MPGISVDLVRGFQGAHPTQFFDDASFYESPLDFLFIFRLAESLSMNIRPDLRESHPNPNSGLAHFF